MRNSSRQTLQELAARLHDLQETVDIQTKRMAQIQAELDVLPEARKRRESLRALLTKQPSSNGNGHSKPPSTSR